LFHLSTVIHGSTNGTTSDDENLLVKHRGKKLGETIP
jgi:hypothetical protein